MKSIDIITAQNVVIEYELASLRERFLAFFIDFVIVMSSYYLLVIFLLTILEDTIAGSNFAAGIIFWLLPIVGFMFYQFLSELLANGQSLGKKAMGTKVVRVDGREPGLSEYTLRAVFHIVDTFLSGGVVGALLISSSIRNQRLGDLTSNTTVVRIRNSERFSLDKILKINTLEDYIPQFPEVVQLNEEDMLLIKESLNRYRTYGNKAHQEAIVSLVEKVSTLLEIEEVPGNKLEFLKTLLRDYIVLTR